MSSDFDEYVPVYFIVEFPHGREGESWAFLLHVLHTSIHMTHRLFTDIRRWASVRTRESLWHQADIRESTQC